VAVDYFTKWVEAKALANITAPTIQKFFWQNIVCKFWVPRELTVDNGKQFDCYSFNEYCKTLGTHAKFSYIIRSLMGLSKEQMSWYSQESKSAYLTRKRASGPMNCRK
jgi:hypothetical protein